MNLPSIIIETIESAIVLKDQYFDLSGLSVYSSLGVPTLRDHIRCGNLPAFKVKGKILVKKSEFDLWVEKHRVSTDVNTIVDDVLNNLK